MSRRLVALALSIALLPLAAPARAEVSAAAAMRAEPGKVVVTWQAKGPVDVFVSDDPAADVAHATRVSDDDKDGRFEAPADALARPYFLLRDEADGKVTRVGERLLPLLQGSNFRDLGGYPAAGGRHVKWGLFFRSGATPLLTREDAAKIQALGLHEMVDLRSNEERVLAPSKIEGVEYVAVGYSMTNLMPKGAITADRMAALYQGFPDLLKPQLKILFADLVRGDGPVVYNCSAGQDRTGFATALILSALGVPRDVIVADYHLSTEYRRPEFEMPKIDPAMAASNPTAAMFASFQKDPNAAKPMPLYSAEHRSLILYALDAVEQRYGSVEAYLDKELGVSAADIEKLRAEYLE
ncbi:MAG: protein-tyrosine-phosphatase [Phenylobacterium sp.]|uniref:tyrosine-protein phosphatase n=1 Tax=Phenylobacterium sp. TaxID=1871053 RepID=UPI0025D5A6A9|nr:tyrosine-protein phosphatase [Phenylobacterium sp.]MBI1200752.1 protein-tyrosine-phosphatase [Phenylobacterium sp.]